MRPINRELKSQVLDYVFSRIQRGERIPSMREIAVSVGCSVGSVHKYLGMLEKEGILTKNGMRNIRFVADNGIKRIPFIDGLSCDSFKEGIQNTPEYITLPRALLGHGTFFAMRASGDSMKGIGVEDGDILIVRKQKTAENGDLVIVKVEDNATFKRIYKENEHFRLHPENADYNDSIVEKCEIKGIVRQTLKELN